MTHWKTNLNSSKKKRHQKTNVMTKKQERKFFGHKFSVLPKKKQLYVTVELNNKQYKVVLNGDKNDNCYDVSGLLSYDGYPTKGIASSHDLFMNIYRGQNVYVIKSILEEAI